MEKRKNNDTEDFLKKFSLDPVPPALKEKILGNTYEKRNRNHIMSVLWKGVAVCLFLSILAIVVDAALSRGQHDQLSSFLDIKEELPAGQEEDRSILEEIIGGPADSPGPALKRALGEREKSNRDKERLNEWREILAKELE